jgi:nucleoside diphosphate kinase
MSFNKEESTPRLMQERSTSPPFNALSSLMLSNRRSLTSIGAIQGQATPHTSTTGTSQATYHLSTNELLIAALDAALELAEEMESYFDRCGPFGRDS